MAAIGLQAIKRQDAPALGLGNPLEADSVRSRPEPDDLTTSRGPAAPYARPTVRDVERRFARALVVLLLTIAFLRVEGRDHDRRGLEKPLAGQEGACPIGGDAEEGTRPHQPRL